MEKTIQTHQFGIVTPFAVNVKFVLMISFGQIDNCDKVAMTLDHWQRFPLGECAADVNIFAATVPFELE